MEPKFRLSWVLTLLFVVTVINGKQTPNKKILALHELGEEIILDADPEIETIKYQRFKEEQEKVKSLQEHSILKKGKKLSKSHERRLSMEVENAMQNLKKDPKFSKYLKHKEQEEVGRQDRRNEAVKSSVRRKRSVDRLVAQNMQSDHWTSEGERLHKRQKRFALTTPASLWPQAKVPYVFDDGYPAEYRTEVLMAFRIYEDLSPIRFVLYTPEVASTVGHNTRLKFIYSQAMSCWSYVGYTGSFTEQLISCYKCGIVACIHEIGHAIGLLHEHQSPLRDTVERINWANIPTMYTSMYEIMDEPGNNAFGRMDLDSVMHYDINIQHSDWTVNYQPQITVFDPDLEELMEWNFNKMQHHYSLKDINEYYKSEADPCGSTLTCGNDGYVTMVRGETCQCVCPQGLNSNCDQLEQDDPVLKSAHWPHGIALLKPTDGCPPGFYGDASVMFKSGNTQTEDDWPATQVTFSGGYWQMQLDFCVGDESTYPDELAFEPGDYCYILKAGESCQSGFTAGSWQFSDISNTASSSGTHFPSGIFSGDKVVLDFCCRSDGWVTVPIKLPNSQPFILFPNYLKACQQVEGMQADMTSFYFNNTVDGYEPYGDYPHLYKFVNEPIFEMYACYYTPLSYNDCGGIYNLDDNTPTLTIQTPNYPNNYPVNRRCSWIFHSPENTKMVLNFDSFDIQVAADGNADDYVEIRHNLPGNMGNMYYGNTALRSWVTYNNYLAVYLFSNNANTGQGFQANIKMVKSTDMCYTGNGENYDGPRSYTRTYKKCINWSEAKANNCSHYPYLDGDVNDNLEGNYCRNPGTRDVPWCFTDADLCQAEFCDVCNLENCYDLHSDCNIQKYKDEFCLVHGRECFTSCGYCDVCYDPMNSQQYSGKIWFSESDVPCKFWKDEGSAYGDSGFPDGSKEAAVNYCRDPDGEKGYPWCFIDSQGGWEPCNVSECGGASSCVPDTESDCATRMDLCSSSEASFCAETCGECAARVTEVQNFPLTCGPPTSPSDATYLPDKDQYGLGEEVIFTCTATGDQVKQTCSTTGNWLPRLQYICGDATVCDSDEIEYDTGDGPRCFKILASYYTYDQAEAECANQGGELVTEKNIESTNALNSLNSIIAYPYWIGLSDTESEGTFKWADGTSLENNKWKAGEPFSYKPKWTGSNTFYASVTWSKTKDGIDCVPWSSKIGISQYTEDSNFPVDGSVANAGSNCRDPSRSGYLWCYTQTSWGVCDLSKKLESSCAGEIESETAYYGTALNYYGSSLVHYHGTENTTSYGETCIDWINTGYPDSYFSFDGTTENAKNYCRDLGWNMPWCYTSFSWTWNTCDVPTYCGGHGFKKTTEYNGTVDATYGGNPCMRWDVAAQYNQGQWLDNSYFPGESMSESENYCRGLIGYEKPWCYYYYLASSDTLYWAYCPVPEEEEKQDCVVRKTDGTWDDVYCDEYNFAICEMPTGKTVCHDQDLDCAQQFEDDPSICLNFPVWATKRCAKTCGTCTESNPDQPNTVICSDPNDSGNFSVVKAPNVTVGDYIEYSCNPLYTLVSGNLKRGCSVSGTWTGSTPFCVLLSEVGGWNNDLSMRDRHGLGPSNAIYLGNNDLMRIQHDGEVTGWRLYSYSPGPLELYVFRTNGQASSFTVVGKTVVEPIPDKREKTVELRPDQRFPVLAGDIIGWGFFSSNDGGIPYDKCRLEYTSGGNIYEKKNTTPLSVGVTADFTLAQDNCRVYSIAVNVGPSSP